MSHTPLTRPATHSALPQAAPSSSVGMGHNGAPDDGFIYETKGDIPSYVPSLVWFQLDIVALRKVLWEMPVKERGFFISSLVAMYEHMEPIPADDDIARRRLGLDIRVYKPLKKKLIEMGYLRLRPTGRISNARFEEEITKWVASHTPNPVRQAAAKARELQKRNEREVEEKSKRSRREVELLFERSRTKL